MYTWINGFIKDGKITTIYKFHWSYLQVTLKLAWPHHYSTAVLPRSHFSHIPFAITWTMLKTPFSVREQIKTVAFLKHFTQITLFKNQYWCWYRFLSRDMGYCFCFGMLFIVMNSYILNIQRTILHLLLGTKPQKHSIHKSFNLYYILPSKFWSWWDLKGPRTSRKSYTEYLALLGTQHTSSSFPNMLNYRYHSRFVALTLHLTFTFFCRFLRLPY